MNAADLSDNELLLLATGPEDNLAKQRKRGPRPVAPPAESPHAHLSDDEILAAIGEPPKPEAYKPTDYAGENKVGPYSQGKQDADTRDRAEANAAVLSGEGTRGLMDGGTQAQRRYVGEKTAARDQEAQAKDFAHFALGGLIFGPLAGAARSAGAPTAVANVVGGAAAGAVPSIAAGGSPGEVAAATVLGGAGGHVMGARNPKAAHEPRTQNELDAAVIQRGKQIHPDPRLQMEGTRENVRLAEEADRLIGQEQAPKIFRRDQLDAEVKNRGISDKAKAGRVEQDWRAALKDASEQNRKTLDEPERAVIEAGPVDTTGHRGMLRAVSQEASGQGGPILPEVVKTVEGARGQMQRATKGPTGDPIVENTADPREMILLREKLNQDARRSKAQDATLEEARLRNAARIVSDLTAPDGTPYRRALDAYGGRKDQLSQIEDTLGPEGSLEPYRNPNAPDPRAAELEGATAEVAAVDKLRGPEGGRVSKLARVGGAGKEAGEGAVVSENEVAGLQQAEPVANTLIDRIRYNNTVGRRGLRLPYIGYGMAGNVERMGKANLGNLAFKLNPPRIDANGMVAAQTARNPNVALPLELELMLLSQEQRKEKRR